MNTTRLEAFSDGVIAILITIMVLELKVPHGADLAALAALAPVFCAYVLSFVFVGGVEPRRGDRRRTQADSRNNGQRLGSICSTRARMSPSNL